MPTNAAWHVLTVYSTSDIITDRLRSVERGDDGSTGFIIQFHDSPSFIMIDVELTCLLRGAPIGD